MMLSKGLPMKFKLKLLALFLALSPSVVFGAKPFEYYADKLDPELRDYAPQGWFWGLSAGHNKLTGWTAFQGFDLRSLGGTDTVEFGSSAQSPFAFNGVKFAPDRGYVASFIWGKRTNRWRFESDFTLRQNKIKKIKNIPVFSPANIPANRDAWPSSIVNPPAFYELRDTGSVTNASWMFNVIYDFYFRRDRIFPFVGAGLGINAAFLRVDFDKLNDTGFGNLVNGPIMDEIIFDLAFQIIMGAGYAINDHADVTLTFKSFMGAIDKFTVRKDNFNVTCTTSNPLDTNKVDGDYKFKNTNNSLVLEFRVFTD